MSIREKIYLGQGPQLWKKAKGIIPGGNQLLSKRAEMFLPEKWPAYYKEAKGVEVWDLDGRRYIDMSIMAIGACVLGYAHEEINRAVKSCIDQGNMSTLNCFEEVQLAETLLGLHPWAGMVRFARSGGEACMQAVRIARASSGRSKVAFCGYHGWGDWYLAANLADDHHLDHQLLPGLEPAGVPQELKGTAIPFHYGDADELKEILAREKGSVGVIMMEVQRYKPIDLAFLKNVRRMADENQCVLIFDEVTSGFRVRAGGMHMLYDVFPDIVVLGKALGNGFPISAVVGKRNVMEAAQKTFISSTYWTERIGFVAALEVIKEFERSNVPAHLSRIGEIIKRGLEKIFKDGRWNIEVCGLAASPMMMIQEKDPLLVKTLFTQEMLKKGFLASNLIYVSLAHTEKIVEQYLQAAQEVLGRMAVARDQGRLSELLEGPICHGGFKRLN
ncbi:MAG: aminotransferase class III-fold pyridoxal phosphate-dependent enzyme [Candidatus Omnitrophica bacterium]|nr:aminotransferase class III-fold pyridoxal phosphate-dependent enzyme [Candidatus Omnitrophota bacterium]